MKLHRIQAKVFLEDAANLDQQDVIPIFHSWIQQQSLGELLIDVADYEHVHEGPGIILIAHEADYAMDVGRGRAGLLYTRKRDVPDDLEEAIRLAVRQVLQASQLLEEELDDLRFQRDEIEITFPDRLRIPNRPESLDLVREPLTAVLTDLFPNADVSLEWTGADERLPFGVRASLERATA